MRDLTPTNSESAEPSGVSAPASNSAPTSADDPRRAPQPSLHMLLTLAQIQSGERGPLTDEEQATWDEHQRQVEEYERRRDLLGLVDLAAVMEGDASQPEMLTDMLVRSEHHTVFGTRESAKTWLLLHDAVVLILQERRVVWVDKEMGRRNIADRLASLGVPPEYVRDHFIYMEFPSMDCSPESRTIWRALLAKSEPALVVVDAYTEVLADARLNENIGTDVEKWSQAYITPARRLGVTTVMIDHTGHNEKGRPVASRQKGAAAKVELSVTKQKKFDRHTVGRVEVEVTKNTVSAPIAERRAFEIGGEDGAFVLREAAQSAVDAAALATAERESRIADQIVSELREAGCPLSQNQIVGLVKGGKTAKIEVLKRLADSETSPVQVQPAGRSLNYSLQDEDEQ